MTDDTTRHLVNRAQVDHARQGAGIARQRTPALQHIEHTVEFLDPVGACAQFVASAGRIVPGLRGQNYTDDEQATAQRSLARGGRPRTGSRLRPRPSAGTLADSTAQSS